MRFDILIPAILLSTRLTGLAAQVSVDELQPGATVRVTAPTARTPACNGQHVFAGLRGDTLMLGDDGTLSCPVEWVDRLEVQRERRGNGWTGAILGAALFGAGGVILAKADCAAYWGSCVNEDDAAKYAVGYGALGVLVGGAAGYGIGSLIKSDRWESVPLHARGSGALMGRSVR
ncbi:MAG: hypothetical protein OEY20_13395 [Gemmatimonadota bacterium]|nr:hypothetical protein [Gemmatimonadota bacterium]MDH4352336.1 hypothetical protein [Gemmatimonadota bacterium]MDH5198232.1 hypothetical protein [Gemmatimonadota bacterium]